VASSLDARLEQDTGTEHRLAETWQAETWQAELQRLLTQDLALACEVRQLLEEQLVPVLSAEERARVHSIIQSVNTTDHHDLPGQRRHHHPPGARRPDSPSKGTRELASDIQR
jgi:hypothetical protein